jgi:hypothetical protein
MRFFAIALLALAACGKPCEQVNGSVDGYCDGQVAYNCVTTCADCIDEWKSATCTGTCGTSATFPPEDKVGGSPPNMSNPALYASCSEWDDTDGS